MKHRVELFSQARVEVMAVSLGLWEIKHANRPLEQVSGQFARGAALSLQRQEEVVNASFMEQRLETAIHRRANSFPLSRPAPVGCRGHRAAIGRKPNQHRVI